MYSEDALTERVCQKRFFQDFVGEIFLVQDAPRSEINSHKMKGLVETNHRYTTKMIADTFRIYKSNVENHLPQLASAGLMFGSRINGMNLTSPKEFPFAIHEKNNPFLKRMMTAEEKWTVYNNVKRKRSWVKRGESWEKQNNIQKGNHPKKITF